MREMSVVGNVTICTLANSAFKAAFRYLLQLHIVSMTTFDTTGGCETKSLMDLMRLHDHPPET